MRLLSKEAQLADHRQKVQEVIKQIYAYDYFVAGWQEVKHKKPLEECSTEELLRPFQDFWSLLPDSRSCRREPFFAICDLAEEYCFGDWREEVTPRCSDEPDEAS